MPIRTRSVFAVLLGLSMLASNANVAVAAKAKTHKTAKGGEAKRHLDAGTKLFHAAKYAGALHELEQAQKLAPRPSTLKMIADCNFKLNEYAIAYGQYEQLSGARGLTKAEAADVKQSLGALELMTGLLEITAEGAKVDVAIDGKSIGKTPFEGPVRVAAGPHKLHASLDGATVLDSDVEVKPGETVPVPIEAVPKTIDTPAVAAATKSGKVSISVTPAEATILIDGEERGTGSFDGELPVGAHKVVVLYVGFKNDEREITVTAGDGDVASAKIDLVPEGDADKPADAASYKGLYVNATLFGGLPIAGATRIPAEPTGTASASTQLGAGLAVRGGYSLGLLGIEATLAYMGERHDEQHVITGSSDPESADFQNGNAQYTESFLIYSLGGFAGVGPRVTTPGQSVRFSVGASPGLSVRRFSLQRSVGIGVLDKFSASATRTSFALAGDASVLIGSTPGFKIVIGVFAFVDLGGVTSTPTGDPHTVTVPSGDHTVDALIPTPPYAVQRGAEVFIGPQIGVQFGH